MHRYLRHSLALAAWLACPAFGEERILARTDVPNRMVAQAEVRLVKRGEEMVVQSAILPRFPKKVLGKIVASERENWPGNADATAYVDALEKAFAEYENKHDMKTVALVIDFVSGPGKPRIDFRFAPAVRDQDGIALKQAPAWRSLELSQEYIRKNQEYILIDAFGKKAAAHIQTLRTALESPHGQ